jgi:hypothetical protein
LHYCQHTHGKHNQFYRLCTDGLTPVHKVTRTDAWKQGCPVYHPITREQITPEQARELSGNKRAYDQNYECVFEDESMALLTYDLINAAERADVGIIYDQNWSEAALAFLEGSARAPACSDWRPRQSPQPPAVRHLSDSGGQRSAGEGADRNTRGRVCSPNHNSVPLSALGRGPG